MSGSDGGRRRVIRWRKSLVQRRVSIRADHLRPQRWNWYGLVRPLDHSLMRQATGPLTGGSLRNLRYFWLDGLFAAISENFYLGYVALFTLAYGASNSQVGFLAAATNLLGMLALFPGALAGGDHQHLFRLPVGRLQSGQFQPAPGIDA